MLSRNTTTAARRSRRSSRISNCNYRRTKKGQKLPNWKRQPSVDYKRHGLKRPGTGQQWVKVGNQYLLVNLATGLILGMTAAR